MNRATLLSKGVILTMRDENEATAPKIGSVGVVGNRIAMVCYNDEEEEAFRAQHPNCRVVDCRDRVIMPGLINTHTHVSMTLMRNYADDMELMEWLTKYIWTFEGKLSDEDIAAGARLGIAEMLLGGCTTFVDMYWSEFAIAREVDRMGARALLAESILDGRESLFVRDMDRLREAAEATSRVECAVAPHAPYTCSPATLAIARDYATKHNLPIMIHLSETTAEREIIAQRYGMSPAHYLDREGIIREDTILAHSIYLSDEDVELIAKRGASVAHNAQSNLKLASGIAPVAKYLRQGVNCTIATDGASSNNDLDMWEELRTASLLQRVVEMNPAALTAYETLKMATLYGAKAIGHDDLGVIEVGALADIITLDLGAIHLRPRHNVVSSLVYGAKASDVEHVFVDGVAVVANRKVVGLDVEALIDECESRCARIIGELKCN